jgi:hypothetical protein
MTTCFEGWVLVSQNTIDYFIFLDKVLMVFECSNQQAVQDKSVAGFM